MKNKVRRRIYLPLPLYDAAMRRAKQDHISFSALAARAIERDLAGDSPLVPIPSLLDGSGGLIDTGEAARRMHLSVWTVRRRARTAGDPIRAARSRVGCQKPMHFHAEKIAGIERATHEKGDRAA